MQNKRENVMVAIFQSPQSLVDAVKSIREDFPKMETLTPFSIDEIKELIPHRPSKVRWFTFTGAWTGAIFAMVYQIMTVLEWGLNTGGKPIVSIPSFVPITFELMILFGAAFTLIGLMLVGELPPVRFQPYYSGASISEFALIVWHPPSEYASLETRLYDAGASGVRPYEETSTLPGRD